LTLPDEAAYTLDAAIAVNTTDPNSALQ